MGRNSAVVVPVDVSPSYQVRVGSGTLVEVAGLVVEATVAVVSDDRVAALYAQRLLETLEGAGKRCRLYTVAPGEASKTLAPYERLLRALATDGFDRGSAVVALGGGVIGDLAGFVAASFMRGIAFYQVPTTLLAMVDASVGGKTGLNLPEGKNLVGAFWQPRVVVADVDLLRSLPARTFRQGAVEAYKHGLLADEGLWRRFQRGDITPDLEPAAMSDFVASAVRVKATVVAQDTFEADTRAHLNLGHTLGHALEAVSGHSLGHGDAVAYGLLFAGLLATGRGWRDLTDELGAFLEWVSPDPLPTPTFDQLEPFLDRDKKNLSGQRRFVLLRDVGDPVVVDDIDRDAQHSAWQALVRSYG